MSVLIKGMEMPQTCSDCRFSTVIAFDKRPLCDALVEYMSYGEWQVKRLDHCPLIPIPPHGRLIDADALYEECTPIGWDGKSRSDYVCAITGHQLKNAPTIIEAEEENHG